MERRDYPCCELEFTAYGTYYKVYDHRGSVMIITENREIAANYLELAHQGISARVLYYLELWHWRVPKRYLDRY